MTEVTKVKRAEQKNKLIKIPFQIEKIDKVFSGAEDSEKLIRIIKNLILFLTNDSYLSDKNKTQISKEIYETEDKEEIKKIKESFVKYNVFKDFGKYFIFNPMFIQKEDGVYVGYMSALISATLFPNAVSFEIEDRKEGQKVDLFEVFFRR